MDNTGNINLRNRTKSISLCELQEDIHFKCSCASLEDQFGVEMDIESKEVTSKRTSITCSLSQDMFIESTETNSLECDRVKRFRFFQDFPSHLEINIFIS